MELTKRSKLSVRITNLGTGPTSPVYRGRPKKMTPAQVAREYKDLKRGGGYVWVEAFLGTKHVPIGDVLELLED